MKTLNKFGIAVVLACAHAGIALAEPLTAVEVHSMTVKYSAAAAQTPTGAKALHTQLRSAARQVCGAGVTGERQMIWAAQKCTSLTLTNAVVAVNIPAVDAVHGYRRGTVEVIARR